MEIEIFNLIKKYIRSKEKFDEYFFGYDEDDKKYVSDVISLLKKIGILNFKLDEKLSKVDFAITNRCNLKCKHCSNSLMETKCIDPQKKDIINTLNKLHSINIKDLCITGGEPLMRYDFSEIVEYARKLFENITLLTNGTLINDSNVYFLSRKFNYISISIDGFDRKSCEKVRGNGVFDKVVSAINILHDNNYYNISLSAVLTTYNDIDSFKKLCDDLNVKPAIRRYAPSGRGKENEEEFFLPIFNDESSEKRSLADYLSYNKINYGFIENATTVCSAFRYNFYIDSDMYIYPCGALNLPEFQGDNICKIKDLREYFTSNQYKQTIGYKKFISVKPQNASYCKGCSVSIFCNDCPAYNYLYHKNGYLKDYCNGCKKYLEEKIYGVNKDNDLAYS